MGAWRRRGDGVNGPFFGAFAAGAFVLIPGAGGTLTELAFADFENATYRLQGASCTYADLFSSGTVGAGNSTLGGNALTTNAAATSGLYGLLSGGGFTAVVDWAGTDLGSGHLYLEMHEPDYVAWWDWVAEAGNPAHAYQFLFDSGTGNDYGEEFLPNTLERAAVSMSADGIAASMNGGSQNAEAGPEGDWEQLTIFEIFNSSAADIKKLVFYSIQPDADLPTLSTLA
jgi:hypothetical protein